MRLEENAYNQFEIANTYNRLTLSRGKQRTLWVAGKKPVELGQATHRTQQVEVPYDVSTVFAPEHSPPTPTSGTIFKYTNRLTIWNLETASQIIWRRSHHISRESQTDADVCTLYAYLCLEWQMESPISLRISLSGTFAKLSKTFVK